MDGVGIKSNGVRIVVTPAGMKERSRSHARERGQLTGFQEAWEETMKEYGNHKKGRDLSIKSFPGRLKGREVHYLLEDDIYY